MGISKRPATTNRELFVEKITGGILSGKWNTGDKLPSERELAAEMGIGKTVVHSGLEKLVDMGLLEAIPKLGYFVTDYMKTGNIETLNTIVRFNGNELNLDIAVAILELRLAIEGMAFRALGLCRTSEDITRLKFLTEEIRKESKDAQIEELAESFFLWHREICIMSKKSFLTLFMNATHHVSIAFWVNYLRMFGITFAADRLGRFTEFLDAHDGEGAYNLLDEGIKDYLARLGS